MTTVPHSSQNLSDHELLSLQRRHVLQGSLGAALSTLLGLTASNAVAAVATTNRLGFKAIAPSRADTVVVPEGYTVQVIAPWGEALGIVGATPSPWREDASNSAQDQAAQMGTHHDGMQFYPLPVQGPAQQAHGLLVMNHEYADDGLLHPGGMVPWTLEKVQKAQAAHGVSVIEIELLKGRWHMVKPSRYARRITVTTPCALRGPAQGHALLKTAANPAADTVLGTVANCAAGKTPWGTYLSGEENFNTYFDGGPELNGHQKRWGMRRKSPLRWAEHDERFDVQRHPNEFNRFGWIVEIDPERPQSPPVKRTALGRAAHEGAWVATTQDQRAVVYSGEDARFEYIYKFVSRDRIQKGGARANANLLDHGTLYVARFDADGTGQWLPLVHGQGPLTREQNFADQGEVLINTRQASDALGATKMDRPEWIAIDQARGEVFCTLTNNSDRGAPGQPAIDAANPRANNVMGHIIGWREHQDFDATTFTWRHLVLAGDPKNTRAQAQGNVQGDAFGCPDGLVIGPTGVLWIQTDVGSTSLNQGEFTGLGNNQMLACDPSTGEVRRFLTGPVGCEITGATFTPDGTTLFVNIQHPGEAAGEQSDPTHVSRSSSWPYGGRPRSATVVIRRSDGGLIGA
jgi:uncharacterized protein